MRKLNVVFVLVLLSFTYSQNVNTMQSLEVSSPNKPLENVHGIVLMTDWVMHNEYFLPVEFMTEFGCNIDIVSDKESIVTSNGVNVETDFLISEMNNVSDYDFFFVPGGTSAGTLTDIPESLALVEEAFEEGLIMVAICAGPIVFVFADIVAGYNISGNVAIQYDVESAGGNFIPDIICIDRQFVTSDFPFMYTLAQQGILKALGYYETNPPEILSYVIDASIIGKIARLSIELEMYDEYATERVTVQVIRNNDDQTQTIYKTFQLEQKKYGIFNSTIDDVPLGNYTLNISAEDVLGNTIDYQLPDQILLQATHKLAIEKSIILFGFVNLLLVFIIKIGKTAKKK